jgi:hypothetical protein
MASGTKQGHRAFRMPQAFGRGFEKRILKAKSGGNS